MAHLIFLTALCVVFIAFTVVHPAAIQAAVNANYHQVGTTLVHKPYESWAIILVVLFALAMMVSSGLIVLAFAGPTEFWKNTRSVKKTTVYTIITAVLFPGVFIMMANSFPMPDPHFAANTAIEKVWVQSVLNDSEATYYTDLGPNAGDGDGQLHAESHHQVYDVVETHRNGQVILSLQLPEKATTPTGEEGLKR